MRLRLPNRNSDVTTQLRPINLICSQIAFTFTYNPQIFYLIVYLIFQVVAQKYTW